MAKKETQHEFISIPNTKAELYTYLSKNVAKNGNFFIIVCVLQLFLLMVDSILI
jgi:hypothetical protein